MFATPRQTKTFTGTGNPGAITLDSMPAAGSCLVLILGQQSNHASTVTGGGGTWTRYVNLASHVVTEMWVCPNVDGTSDQVTLTLAVNGGATAIVIAEWTGAAAAPVDVAATAGGATSPIAVGPIVPAQPFELVVAATGSDSDPAAPTNGFTELVATLNSGSVFLTTAYRINGPAKPATSTSWTASIPSWDAGIVGLIGSGLDELRPSRASFPVPVLRRADA